MTREFDSIPRPAASPPLDVAAYSRRGSYAVNEDAVGGTLGNGVALLVVADGLGGHEHGAQASKLALDHVVQRFKQAPSLAAGDLEALIHSAHQAVRETSSPPASGPRTTLTVLVSDGMTARWAHVGDSRLYYLHAGAVAARTRDHSVPELLHRVGDISDDEIRHHPDRSRLLQALGQESDPKVAVSESLAVQSGDAFLLCTDGWWEAVPESDMERLLHEAANTNEWLERMAATIVAAARHPQDNYSAIAARVT